MTGRLEQFIKNQGFSVRAFEISIGASDGMIRRAIKNNTDIQSKWLSVISDNYPNLNIDWLLTGRVSMLKSEEVPLMGDKKAKTLPVTDSADIGIYYTLYKEEKAENKALIEQIGSLKQQIKQLESTIEGLQQKLVDLVSGNGDAPGASIAGVG